MYLVIWIDNEAFTYCTYSLINQEVESEYYFFLLEIRFALLSVTRSNLFLPVIV